MSNQEKIDFYKTLLGESWTREMQTFLVSKTMDGIGQHVSARRKLVHVYPSKENLFRAFSLCPLDKVRVVILGQDPYHTPGYATGLAFSSGIDYPLPPSLRNILKELDADLFDKMNLELEFKHDLTSWAEQGVLLLNTSLSVEKGRAGIHTQLWEPFTKEVFRALSSQTGIIYVLWGGHAKGFRKYINEKHNFVLESAHPSPLSAHRGFFGCRHFSQINKIIEEQNGKEFIIKWD